MGPVILLLVTVFHTVVFCGLAYWMSASPQFKFTPKQAGLWFVSGAVLANIVLCAMLYEVYNGITIAAGGDTEGSGLGGFMKIVIGIQPFYALALYPVLSGIIRKRTESRPALYPVN